MCRKAPVASLVRAPAQVCPGAGACAPLLARTGATPGGGSPASAISEGTAHGTKDKLARCDALITGWGHTEEPFLSAGLPMVIVVFPQEPMALAVAKLAGALVRGRIASLEDRQRAWPYAGRKHMFFAPSATCTGARCGRGSSRSCAPTCGGGARVGGTPMTVELAHRDMIKADVLSLHRASSRASRVP